MLAELAITSGGAEAAAAVPERLDQTRAYEQAVMEETAYYVHFPEKMFITRAAAVAVYIKALRVTVEMAAVEMAAVAALRLPPGMIIRAAAEAAVMETAGPLAFLERAVRESSLSDTGQIEKRSTGEREKHCQGAT
jgi:hypothetical protein